MSIAARLIGFTALLAVVFGAAALAGDAADPDPVGEPAAHAGSSPAHAEDPHGAAPASAGHSEHGARPAAVRGLAVGESGYTLRLQRDELDADRSQALRFRIVDSDERAVTAFDVEHERRMHLILVRRDATGFQHLHPRMRDDGTWQIRARLTEPGSYRVFADFSTGGQALTLGADLAVDGRAEYRGLPESAPLADAGEGIQVRLDHDELRAGRGAELAFTVHQDGRAVHTEPYLGAGGHLVALREGDLAFLHTHPSEHADTGGEHSDAVAFESTFPSAGRYRLFLQFKLDGQVRTAAFTVEVQP